MKSPGVILNRQILLLYRDRGIILQNAITGRQEPLDDWIAIRDLGQARDVLRQNEYELTAVDRLAKKRVISFLGYVGGSQCQLQRESHPRLGELASEEVNQVLVQVRKGRTLVRSGDEVGAREILCSTVSRASSNRAGLRGSSSGSDHGRVLPVRSGPLCRHGERGEGGGAQVPCPVVAGAPFHAGGLQGLCGFRRLLVEGIGFERFRNPWISILWCPRRPAPSSPFF